MRHKLSLSVGWKAGAGACALALAFVAGGCAPDYVTSSTAPVNLLIAGINDGNVLNSDVRAAGRSVPTRSRSPSRSGRRTRTPSRSPFPSTCSSSSTRCATSAPTGGRTRASTCPTATRARWPPRSTSPPPARPPFPCQVVRRQAKLEPPLSNITGLPDRQHDRRDHHLGPDRGGRGRVGDRKDAGRLRGPRRRRDGLRDPVDRRRDHAHCRKSSPSADGGGRRSRADAGRLRLRARQGRDAAAHRSLGDRLLRAAHRAAGHPQRRRGERLRRPAHPPRLAGQGRRRAAPSCSSSTATGRCCPPPPRATSGRSRAAS